MQIHTHATFLFATMEQKLNKSLVKMMAHENCIATSKIISPHCM